MSSEEEDYMSDKFLIGTAEKNKPGLIKHRSLVRENEVQAKKARIDSEAKNRNKPAKVVEREMREDGLSKSIKSDNKGFAMLAKMGYKEGQAIGKSAQGIVEPIGIKIKSDRCGLGRDTALKELHQMRNELLQKKASIHNKTEISTEEFRKRFSQKHDMKMIESAIFKCQKVCERLDKEDEILEPALSWFWPKREKPPCDQPDEEQLDPEVDEEEEHYEPSEKLEMINKFLRTSYNYCHWCGVRYDDVTDMMENCPGPGKDDH